MRFLCCHHFNIHPRCVIRIWKRFAIFWGFSFWDLIERAIRTIFGEVDSLFQGSKTCADSWTPSVGRLRMRRKVAQISSFHSPCNCCRKQHPLGYHNVFGYFIRSLILFCTLDCGQYDLLSVPKRYRRNILHSLMLNNCCFTRYKRIKVIFHTILDKISNSCISTSRWGWTWWISLVQKTNLQSFAGRQISLSVCFRAIFAGRIKL